MNILRTLIDLVVRPASAHCDTEDGPAVVDGRRALAEGNVNIALKWVHPDGEDEVRAAFEAARGSEGASEQEFLETLVRVHRAGEGAGFDGIKAAGADVPPAVVAADEAIERRTIEPLRGLVAEDRWAELERRFDRAMQLGDFDEDDLVAARQWMEAYVAFFKYAEGHDDDHHHGAHGHHAHAGHGH